MVQVQTTTIQQLTITQKLKKQYDPIHFTYAHTLNSQMIELRTTQQTKRQN